MQTCAGVHTYDVQLMVRRRTADCIRLGGQVVVVIYYQRASRAWVLVGVAGPPRSSLDMVAVDAEAEPGTRDAMYFTCMRSLILPSISKICKPDETATRIPVDTNTRPSDPRLSGTVNVTVVTVVSLSGLGDATASRVASLA